MFLHFLDFFLAHRPPQQIRFAKRITGQQLRRLHHLLLVNQDAIGLAGNGFEQRVLIFDLNLAVASFDEIRNQVHGTGTIQGNECRDVFHGTDLKFFAKITHAAGFQLEHPQRFRPIQKIISFLVVQRQVIDWDFYFVGLLHHLAGIADDGQGFEPKKIHFEQTQVPDRIHRVLRDQRPIFVLLQR